MPPSAVHIAACMALLAAAIVSADPQEGVTIHITGPVSVIIGSSADGTNQEGYDGVPSAEQCSREDGFCVPTGDRCNGAIKLLQNSCNDHCTCCVPEKQDCPGDFFMPSGSSQCFKYYNDRPRNYEQAKNKCVSEGLLLPKIPDTMALALRDYLHDIHGQNVYLGARGDGYNIRWERDGEVLASRNPLWWPDEPEDVTSNTCLMVKTDDYNFEEYPTQPYSTYGCTGYLMTLCELGME